MAALFLCTSFTDDEKKTNSKIRTIVIDPGHGGKDSGTMGTKRFKIYEKHVALAVSLKLGDYIKNAFPNVDVVYTRDSDVFLELNERTELANNVNADLFISIHCDGFTNSTPSGASVFVMGMSKLKANMDIAIRENSAIYMEDNYQQKYEGFDPKSAESYIVFSLMQNTHLNQSLKIAEEVEKEFSTKANRKSRGVKQAPFYVISRTNMPSILIECGFLTNFKEEEYLHSEIGQEYIASAIFRGFKAYKENYEGTTSEKELEEPIVLKEDRLKKPTPKKEITIEKVVFKVQVGTYLKSMLNDALFKEINAEQQVINGTFKYYVGNETDKSSVDKLKNQLKEKGFKGAFVVAFYKGERISTKEALDLQTKINNHE
ncbi:MAG: N-acetylmuramoyl-L-alanine amidase [Flavobacteriales bacterium]